MKEEALEVGSAAHSTTLILSELTLRVLEYYIGRKSLVDFADWFEENSGGAYDTPVVREACIAIDAAFSEYYYDHIGEVAFKETLVKTVVQACQTSDWN